MSFLSKSFKLKASLATTGSASDDGRSVPRGTRAMPCRGSADLVVGFCILAALCRSVFSHAADPPTVSLAQHVSS